MIPATVLPFPTPAPSPKKNLRDLLEKQNVKKHPSIESGLLNFYQNGEQYGYLKPLLWCVLGCRLVSEGITFLTIIMEPSLLPTHDVISVLGSTVAF